MTVFLCLLGRQGLRRLARQNVTRSHYARDLLIRSAGVRRVFRPVFNEFVLRVDNAEAVWQRLTAEGLVAGLPLYEWYPELADCLLVCVTETHPRAAIERLARSLGAGAKAVQ